MNSDILSLKTIINKLELFNETFKKKRYVIACNQIN